MPNRMIRSGFLDSDKINSIDPDEQMFFVRLMLVADDFGCFDARLEMLRSQCYPLTDICLSDVRRMLDACCRVGLVEKYEDEGKKYLFIPNFGQRLRKRVRRFPEPHENNKVTDYEKNIEKTCQSNDGQLSVKCRPEVEVEVEVEKNKRKYIKEKFSIPTIEQVSEYCRERNNRIDPECFIDFYTSKNWMIGKNKMKDWKAAIRTWERHGDKNRYLTPAEKTMQTLDRMEREGRL
jgi:hypothetical protein